eukprot:3743794-Rhodomonas_salina.3
MRVPCAVDGCVSLVLDSLCVWCLCRDGALPLVFLSLSTPLRLFVSSLHAHTFPLCSVRYCPTVCSYAEADVLRFRNAMSGTELGYAATRARVLHRPYDRQGTSCAYLLRPVCICYAQSGTDAQSGTH